MTINPIGTLFQYIQWDEYEGFIRNPFAFYFLIQWGFSGPIQTLGPFVENSTNS